jgi:hypothetical protein
MNSLRSKSFSEKVSILRTLVNAPSARHLMQMYQYKVDSQKEYQRIADEVKREYKNGDLDPA